MGYRRDDVNSLIRKIGLSVGMKNENMSLYRKFSAAHEFGGEVKSRYQEENKDPVNVSLSLEDIWIELEVGGTYKMRDNSYFYGSLTENFGAKMNNKWRLDAGIWSVF